MREIKTIYVHSSATPRSMDIGVKEITKWHKDRGFRTIGYHYVIRRNGVLEYGRLDKETGAHVYGDNKHSIGICMIGGIDKDGKPENNFTKVQFDTLIKLLNELQVKYKNAIIQGHRDYAKAKTACPSFDVKSWWADVNKKETVKCQDTKHSLSHYLSRFLEHLRALITPNF